MNKVVKSASEAVQGIQNGMTLMLGGFGLCGIPENSIAALVEMNITDPVCQDLMSVTMNDYNPLKPIQDGLHLFGIVGPEIPLFV